MRVSGQPSDSRHCCQCEESRFQNALCCTRNHSIVAVPQVHLLPRCDKFRPSYSPCNVLYGVSVYSFLHYAEETIHDLRSARLDAVYVVAALDGCAAAA
jgi:hypothetical protein